MQQRLVRRHSDRKIAGVCSGIAAYLDIDPLYVRLAFLILLFASAIGIPLYLILVILMPKSSDPDAEQLYKTALIKEKPDQLNRALFYALLAVAGLALLLGDGIAIWGIFSLFLVGVAVWFIRRR